MEKVWGGRALEARLGLELPPGQPGGPPPPVGESWELVDREDVSSIVAEGPEAGRTLGELLQQDAEAILGKAPANARGRFPLLLKYLDARDNLSVQVHPEEEVARRMGGGAQGKTEAWYVLGAEPGACLYAGLKSGLDAASFREVATGPAVVETMHRWEVEAGDCMVVPGGTVHAIGAGITLFEVQQNSDTTWRIWDWGRMGLDGAPRETHLDQALAGIDFDQPARPPVKPVWEPATEARPARAALARSRWFAMNALAFAAPARLSSANQYQIYSVTAGSGRLGVRATGTEVTLNLGDTWLVPAACGYHDVEPGPDGLTLVQCQWRA